jgi:thioredoxin 1
VNSFEKETTMAGHVLEVSDATFQKEVLESSVPVLVDFWTPGCPPCGQMLPAVESLAQEYLGRVKVAKLNAFKDQATATAYHVEYVPTFILFKGGHAVERLQGAHPKSRLVQMLSQV